MNSQNELLNRIGDPTIATNPQVGLQYDLARHLRQRWNFERDADTLYAAQTNETRPRAVLRKRCIKDAARSIKKAERVLEECGEQLLLSETLILHGIVLARLDDFQQAYKTLERAADVALEAGDLERAGMATITLIERLGHRLSHTELSAAIKRASNLLKATGASTARPDWSTFNLKEVQLRNECHYVEQALADANGSVTRAAELLGLASHQSLLYMLNGRLKNLVNARTPIKRRRRRSEISRNK